MAKARRRRRTFYRDDWADITRRPDVTALDKLLLMTIASFQGDGADAWPSLELLAVELGASKQGVHTALERCERAGLLKITRGRPGARGVKSEPNRYSVVPPGEVPAPAPESGQRSRPQSGQRSRPRPERSDPLTERSDPLVGAVSRVDPNLSREPHQEPHQERTRAIREVIEYFEERTGGDVPDPHGTRAMIADRLAGVNGPAFTVEQLRTCVDRMLAGDGWFAKKRTESERRLPAFMFGLTKAGVPRPEIILREDGGRGPGEPEAPPTEFARLREEKVRLTSLGKHTEAERVERRLREIADEGRRKKGLPRVPREP